MAAIRSLYQMAKGPTGPDSNYGVDYVIKFNIDGEKWEEAEATYIQLMESLTRLGLATEVRQCDKDSLLLFVRLASDKLLQAQVYRARLQDWLYGVRAATPDKDLKACFEREPVTEAEKLRLVYLLLTKPKTEGGAGITPNSGKWKSVESIFPLHDPEFNRTWITKKWNSKLFLSEEDVDEIRGKFGEQIALYFAFMRNYFLFLIFPASFGFGVWLLIGPFSWIYGIINCLWTVVFFEYWKAKETDLAVRWGVRGVSKIQHPRPQFHFDREAQDPVTGEIIRIYSPVKRFYRQLLQVPFAIVCFFGLGGLIVLCFMIEIFFREVYTGPFQPYLVFLPTVILTVFIPTISTLLTGVAEKLTKVENYETLDSHKAAMIQKIFVLNFITSYLPLLLTAFVYVPFGQIIYPHLDLFQSRFQSQAKMDAAPEPRAYKMDHNRLGSQVIYFTVTAQIINYVTEALLPIAKRMAFNVAKGIKEAKKGTPPLIQDAKEEAEFLKRVRAESEMDKYDVTVDYREMIVQFGYLALFSVVWPLAGGSFVINNWIEIRSDAMKMVSCQRPIPWRAESIGPWLTSVGFLSWLGSLTMAALLYLFHGDERGPMGVPWGLSAWGLLLSIFFAEHIYLMVQLVVRFVVGKLESPGLQMEKAARFAMRKALLIDTLGPDAAEHATSTTLNSSEQMTRAALEEEAKISSSKEGGGTPEEQFWQRQRSSAETITVGRRMIVQIGAETDKDKQKS